MKSTSSGLLPLLHYLFTLHASDLHRTPWPRLGSRQKSHRAVASDCNRRRISRRLKLRSTRRRRYVPRSADRRNDIDNNQTSAASGINKPKRFRRPRQRVSCKILKLPGELRNRIWRHAIVSANVVQMTTKGPGEPALLRMSLKPTSSSWEIN